MRPILFIVVPPGYLYKPTSLKAYAIPFLSVAQVNATLISVARGDLFGIPKRKAFMPYLRQKVRDTERGVDSIFSHVGGKERIVKDHEVGRAVCHNEVG